MRKRLTPEDASTLKQYVRLRFFHRGEAEMHDIQRRITRTLKAQPEQRAAFMEKARAFIDRHAHMVQQPTEGGLSDMDVNNNQVLIEGLVTPYGGDMNAVMRAILGR